MSVLEDFLTANEEEAVVEAIRKAEQKTSGEIRVHIETSCDTDIMEHAMEVFHYLKMDNTKDENGVLIYIAIKKRAFVIYGDKGINDKVGISFWNSTRDTIAQHFQNGEFSKGLIKVIEKAGEALSKYFPWQHGDMNELDNSVSKG